MSMSNASGSVVSEPSVSVKVPPVAPSSFTVCTSRSPQALHQVTLYAVTSSPPSLTGGNHDTSRLVSESTTTDGRVCSVGPYGWFRDPPAVENDVTYYTPIDFNTPGSFKPIVREGSLVGAIPEGLPVPCMETDENGAYKCSDNCLPPCPPECVAQKFETRRTALIEGTAGVTVPENHHFYVNPYGGDDANDGTRARPWKTLKRAQMRVRYLRTTDFNRDPGAPDYPNDSGKLQIPVQLWIRAIDPDQTSDEAPPDSQLNARYDGITITE